MFLLILGLVLFLGTHAFTRLRSRREAVIGRIGENRYKLGYTALSLLGDRKSTRLNSSHSGESRMPSSA